MRKLSPKKSGFVGKSLFVREDLTYEIATSETLPETFELGFEIPEESGGYFARTQFGALYIRVTGSNIEILPWSTFSGIYGDYTFTGGAVIPTKTTHNMFLLTDGESDGGQFGGESSFNYGSGGTFDDGNGEYARSFVEIGDSFIVPQQPMSLNKNTGDINWMYIDGDNRPAFPWGLRNNRSVVNERYFIFLNRNTTIIVLNTETGEVIEEVPMSVISNVDSVDEGNLFQLPNTNEFLYMGDDYVNSVGRAFILSVDENAAPGSRITVVEHPESGVLHSGKQLFWGWYEFGSYWYWGIWNLCYLLDPEEGSYYLFYLSDFNTRTGSLAKFNSSHTLEWVYDLYDIPVFGDYIWYTFVKANGRVALLPSYTENSNVSPPIVVLNDTDGTSIAVSSTENDKIAAYTNATNNQYPTFLYAKAPSGSRIPFIASVETYDEQTFTKEPAFIYGYFDVDTLTWVENTATNVPEGTFYTWFSYPRDSRTACLQKQADGSYFYFIETWAGVQFSSFFDSHYIVKLSSDFSSVSFEELDYGGLSGSQTITSTQSTVSSEGRFFGITNENMIVSSTLDDDRPRINLNQDVVLEKDIWYDFKSAGWNTGIRPIVQLHVNARTIHSTSAYPSSAKHIPLNFDNILDLNTGRIQRYQSNTVSTTIAPDQQTIMGASSSTGSGNIILTLNSLTGAIENPNAYPLYGIAARHLFRQDGTPIVVTATTTQATVRRHNGTSWVADTVINLASASSQRYFLHNDLLYAFRAVTGGNAIVSVYNWDTPGWSTHNSIPTPVGTTTYYDTTASFTSLVSAAYGNGVLYLSNGFEYNMGTGLMTEVPYAETFYSAYRVSGGITNNRITLQIVGDYMYMFYSRPGVGYLAVRPLSDNLPPPF